MALVICRECGAEISSKAITCPKCGFSKNSGFSFEDGVGLFIFFIVAIVGVAFLPYVLSSYLGFQGASVVYKSEKNNKTKSGIKKKKKNALILALILGTIGFAGGKWIRNEIDPSLTPGNVIKSVQEFEFESESRSKSEPCFGNDCHFVEVSKDQLTCINCSTLKIPSEARRKGLRGEAKVKFWIFKSGDIKRAEIISSSGNIIIDNEALVVIKQLKFSPLPKDSFSVSNYTVD